MSTIKRQAIRFGAVGAANTLIDFAVFNLLMYLLEAGTGNLLILCNSIAFLCASLNSYLLNKIWTFKDRGRVSAIQYLVFLLFSLGGLTLNNLTVYLLTTRLPVPGWMNPTLWANLSKIVATGATVLWNFTCCRHFIFRKKNPPLRRT